MIIFSPSSYVAIYVQTLVCIDIHMWFYEINVFVLTCLCQMSTVFRYSFLNKKVTKHYRIRRILINLILPVPFLLVFSLFFISDFTSEIYILRKTQGLPNFTRFTKWNETIQKITNMKNETELIRSNMISLLQELKRHVISDIEDME